jgi:hypothetical protein
MGYLPLYDVSLVMCTCKTLKGPAKRFIDQHSDVQKLRNMSSGCFLDEDMYLAALAKTGLKHPIRKFVSQKCFDEGSKFGPRLLARAISIPWTSPGMCTFEIVREIHYQFGIAPSTFFSNANLGRAMTNINDRFFFYDPRAAAWLLHDIFIPFRNSSLDMPGHELDRHSPTKVPSRKLQRLANLALEIFYRACESVGSSELWFAVARDIVTSISEVAANIYWRNVLERVCKMANCDNNSESAQTIVIRMAEWIRCAVLGPVLGRSLISDRFLDDLISFTCQHGHLLVAKWLFDIAKGNGNQQLNLMNLPELISNSKKHLDIVIWLCGEIITIYKSGDEVCYSFRDHITIECTLQEICTIDSPKALEAMRALVTTFRLGRNSYWPLTRCARYVTARMIINGASLDAAKFLLIDTFRINRIDNDVELIIYDVFARLVSLEQKDVPPPNVDIIRWIATKVLEVHPEDLESASKLIEDNDDNETVACWYNLLYPATISQ